jgi:hypothetical protein
MKDRSRRRTPCPIARASSATPKMISAPNASMARRHFGEILIP